MYDSQHDANQALTDSIISYKGRSIYVTSAIAGNGKIVINTKDMLTGKGETIDVKDPDLNFQSPKLGYVNFENGAVYVARKPRRQWKQGLYKTCLISMPQKQGRDLICSSLVRTIEGVYPSFEECVNRVQIPGISSVAFCREFAITSRGQLCFKGREVGLTAGVKFILIKRYEHLRELLDRRMKQ